jgi:hypothetical protein
LSVGRAALNRARKWQEVSEVPHIFGTLTADAKREVGPSGRFVSYRKKSVGSILHMWRLTRTEAGLDERETPYSIRHGLAREMRKRRVPTEQISLFLGHLPDGSAATTSIDAPYEPGFLTDAVEAIESVMSEVRTHLKHARIDRPDVDPAEAANTSLKTHRRGVGETKREEVRFLICYSACNFDPLSWGIGFQY